MRDKGLADRRIAFFLAFLLVVLPGTLLASSLPDKGTILPTIELPIPPIEEDQKYLGVTGENFELKDLDCRLLLVEIIGVYCPRCYEQAPLFNRLFARLNRRSMNDQIKMLAVAAGGTVMEIKQLRESGAYHYPIVKDESFSIHKLLGEPRTPYTMIVDGEGKVLYTHMGVMEDIDGFYQIIQDLLK